MMRKVDIRARMFENDDDSPTRSRKIDGR